MANRLTSSAVSGTMSVISETATRAPAARRGGRAIASPAHEPKSTVSGTAKATTINEFTA